jgi:hypothetical protein
MRSCRGDNTAHILWESQEGGTGALPADVRKRQGVCIQTALTHECAACYGEDFLILGDKTSNWADGWRAILSKDLIAQLFFLSAAATYNECVPEITGHYSWIQKLTCLSEMLKSPPTRDAL